MQIQSNLGSTIAMAFDECAPGMRTENISRILLTEHTAG